MAGVIFNESAAKRIAAVVRKVEGMPADLRMPSRRKAVSGGGGCFHMDKMFKFSPGAVGSNTGVYVSQAAAYSGSGAVTHKECQLKHVDIVVGISAGSATGYYAKNLTTGATSAVIPTSSFAGGYVLVGTLAISPAIDVGETDVVAIVATTIGGIAVYVETSFYFEY